MDTQTKITPVGAELQKFVDNLVAEKKFEVEPEVLQQIEEDVYERADDIINATIVAETPPERLEELNQLLEQANPVALENFCKSIPNLQDKIAEALMRFRNTYLGSQ